MLRLLWNPSEAILDIKSKKSYPTVLITLIVSSLFLGLSTLFLALLKMPLQNAINFGILSFAGSILLLIYTGFVTKIVMKALTGEGDYFSGLTSIVYPFFPKSVGLLIGSLSLIWIVALDTQLTSVILLSLIILAMPLLSAISCSALFRCLKELFKTNMFNSLLGFFVIIFSMIFLFALIYVGAILILQGNDLLNLFGLTNEYLLR